MDTVLRTSPDGRETPGRSDANDRLHGTSSRWLRRLQGRLLVDRALQFNLVTRTVILILFVFAILNGVLFAPFAEELRVGTPLDPAVIQSLLDLHAVIWPAAGFCVLVAVASALFLSHRIAGPLVRVKNAMRNIEHGTLPGTIDTRPRDYFKDEVRVLNQMIGGLRAQLAEIEHATAQVDHALDEGAAHAGRDPGVQRAFAKAHRRNGVVRGLVATWGAAPPKPDGSRGSG